MRNTVNRVLYPVTPGLSPNCMNEEPPNEAVILLALIAIMVSVTLVANFIFYLITGGL